MLCHEPTRVKLLIQNGHVIRWNGNRVEQLAAHHVLIEDHRIRDVVATVPADFVPDETINATKYFRRSALAARVVRYSP